MVTDRIGGHRRQHLYLDEWFGHLGLTDEKVANRLGVARETITRWRGQQHRLNPGKIAALASALDRDPVELYELPSRPSIDAKLAFASDDLRAEDRFDCRYSVENWHVKLRHFWNFDSKRL